MEVLIYSEEAWSVAIAQSVHTPAKQYISKGESKSKQVMTADREG